MKLFMLMKSLMINKMRSSELHKKDYEAMKASVISDMWFLIKDRDGSALDIMEETGIPAIVTGNFDDQESETIDELIVRKDKVIAVASSAYDDVNEYDLEEWEVPFLIAILDSVEKHIALEEKKKNRKRK